VDFGQAGLHQPEQLRAPAGTVGGQVVERWTRDQFCSRFCHTSSVWHRFPVTAVCHHLRIQSRMALADVGAAVLTGRFKVP
jgi:hypothetical protein